MSRLLLLFFSTKYKIPVNAITAKESNILVAAPKYMLMFTINTTIAPNETIAIILSANRRKKQRLIIQTTADASMSSLIPSGSISKIVAVANIIVAAMSMWSTPELKCFLVAVM